MKYKDLLFIHSVYNNDFDLGEASVFGKFWFQIYDARNVSDLPKWHELHQAKNIDIDRDEFNYLVKFAEEIRSILVGQF